MTIRLFVTTVLLILLAACATTPVKKSIKAHDQLPQLPQSSNTYLKQSAQQESTDKQNHYQLLAVARLLQDDNTNAAQQELTKLTPEDLSERQQTFYYTLQAYLQLSLGEPKQALNELQKAHHPQQLSNLQQRIYYEIAKQIYLRTNHLKEHVIAAMNSLSLNSSANPIELQILWRSLQNLPTHDLERLLQTHPSRQVEGWASLALLTHQNTLSTSELAQKIQQWQDNYPNHPANQLLPDTTAINTLVQHQPPQQIALLLPLSGKFSAMGHAILNGFMTAYYNLNNQTQQPALRTYDTNTTSVTTLYQQAVNQGAKVVIGPLTKTHVTQLLEGSDLSVPTLVLNYATSQNSDHLIKFGLSPTQAAQQMANRAWQQGVSKILTITPDSQWGKNVLSSFQKTWQNLGGEVVGSLQFKSQNLADQIAGLLQVRQSINRKKALEKDLDKKLEFTPHRRYDAGGIFLVAPPDQAREIRPLLKFYFAGKLPVFATSLLYNGYPQPQHNKDLDPIYFGDMPFLLSQAQPIKELRNTIKKNWPNNYRSYNRLFGIGIDALRLSLAFKQLKALPSFSISGVTGRLYLNNGTIQRHLALAQFKQGRAHLISE